MVISVIDLYFIDTWKDPDSPGQDQAPSYNVSGVMFMESYKPDAQRIIGVGRVQNGAQAKRSNNSGTRDYVHYLLFHGRNRERGLFQPIISGTGWLLFRPLL